MSTATTNAFWPNLLFQHHGMQTPANKPRRSTQANTTLDFLAVKKVILLFTQGQIRYWNHTHCNPLVLNFSVLRPNETNHRQKLGFSHSQGGVRIFDAHVKILTPRHLCENHHFAQTLGVFTLVTWQQNFDAHVKNLWLVSIGRHVDFWCARQKFWRRPTARHQCENPLMANKQNWKTAWGKLYNRDWSSSANSELDPTTHEVTESVQKGQHRRMPRHTSGAKRETLYTCGSLAKSLPNRM